MTPLDLFGDGRCILYCGDCLEILPTLEAGSVDAVVTDPPYFKVKNEAWDRQWNTAGGFLHWLGGQCDEWARLMKPNASLYCFASPQMAAGVETTVAKRLNVLNNIRWVKDSGWHKKASKDKMRSWLSPWEAVTFKPGQRVEARE